VTHPFRDVIVAGIFNTRQARVLEGHDSLSITLEAARGVLDDAGIDIHDVDGVVGSQSGEVIHTLGIGPVWHSPSPLGIPAVLEAAAVIAAGLCETVMIAAGGAAIYTQRAATAPWTRPNNEFVAPFGLFTAAEFALIARRHMHMYGTTPEHLATVAATIRNNGHVNPEAVYFGRGPFTPADILASRMVADPFHLLDCAMTSEGGCALLLTHAKHQQQLRQPPVWILGGGSDQFGPAYRHAPSWDLTSREGRASRASREGRASRQNQDPNGPNGYVGRRAARKAFAMAGMGPADVDVCEFYDPFSFEIIRQFEAFEFCKPGEGPDFVMDGTIGPGGRYPITTDGGLMSFSHGGASVQMLQRVVRGVQQIRQACPTRQVDGAEVAMCTGGGAGALFNDVILLGSARP
jgi:acetyl-CoA acetyltransferase